MVYRRDGNVNDNGNAANEDKAKNLANLRRLVESAFKKRRNY